MRQKACGPYIFLLYSLFINLVPLFFKANRLSQIYCLCIMLVTIARRRGFQPASQTKDLKTGISQHDEN